VAAAAGRETIHRPLPGTENSRFPFWSPDSRIVAFLFGGKLKKLEVSGGLPIADLQQRRGAWRNLSVDGTILFSPEFRTGLFRVPAMGGEPAPVTRVDETTHSSHRWPQFLPDGQHFLYLASVTIRSKARMTRSTGLRSRTPEPDVDAKARANANYASGHLLVHARHRSVAQPFDPTRGEFPG